MGWIEFIAAFAAFFATHSIPLRPAVRGAVTARIGRRGFTAAYSLLSLAALIWLIVAAGRAPYVELWPRWPWQTWVPLIAMALVCVIVALALGRPNPFSFGGVRAEAFDPARPGIVRVLRHPMLAALALWAAGHMVPNGDLAHVLLFGVFAGFAVLGIRMIDRRKRRVMGADAWEALRAQVRRASPLPPLSWSGASLRVVIALAVYGTLLALHPMVIGVSPLP